MWPSRGLHKDCIWQLYVCGLWVRGLWVTPTDKIAAAVCQRIIDRLYSIVVRKFYMQTLWGSYVRFSWSCLVAKGAPVRWIRLLEHNPRAADLWCIIADLPLRHCDIYHLTHLHIMEEVMTEFDNWAIGQRDTCVIFCKRVTFLACLDWFWALFTKETLLKFFKETLCKKETKISFFYGCW